MESKGGCCIARYEASGVYNRSTVDRIMLRFRPIAPKPATGGGGGSVSPRENTTGVYNSKPAGRGKRRQYYSRETSTKKKRKVLSEEKRVTLPLISETPDCKLDSINISKEKKEESFSVLGGESVNREVKVAVGCWSCVTVECVTDTWVSGDGIGSTDEERKVNLRKDTCPGFISDLLGRVRWTNEAYREMVGGGEMRSTVRLVMKESLPPVMIFPAFACRVRVQYICGKDMKSLTVPCDVWRMDGGGFAWRLDIDAALCLGR